VGLPPCWSEKRRSVGLRNTIARLELLFLGQHGFSVRPGHPRGTVVQFRLLDPARDPSA
jgi:hypothetical protein